MTAASPGERAAAPAGSADAPPLAIQHVSHSFGARPALRDVSITVARGRFNVLLGPNGAGKTTLFALATRLYDNRSGAIRVFGSDMRKEPTQALARIGVVFQQRTLDLDLSVAQNLYYHAALHGMARSVARQRMAEELDRLGLLDRMHSKVRQLSGGQLRRVEIARALLHRPQLLLLDEPTVGLDIASRQTILDHARSLVERSRLALLWATHLIDEVAPGDRVVILYQGRVLADGGVVELLRRTGAADIRGAYQRLTAGGGE